MLAYGGSAPPAKAAWLAEKYTSPKESWLQGVEVTIDALLGTSFKVERRAIPIARLSPQTGILRRCKLASCAGDCAD
ncbi:hypothetical protein, partial [Sodalis-like endosymbiont of Proechinophthirus fluctus]|uniref:hypothetical protein n=1 Tax=Sodalis-like endosymbiont of Proechinophthirus fluctus TaxID=1462730 RepID=UPI00164F66B1